MLIFRIILSNLVSNMRYAINQSFYHLLIRIFDIRILFCYRLILDFLFKFIRTIDAYIVVIRRNHLQLKIKNEFRFKFIPCRVVAYIKQTTQFNICASNPRIEFFDGMVAFFIECNFCHVDFNLKFIQILIRAKPPSRRLLIAIVCRVIPWHSHRIIKIITNAILDSPEFLVYIKAEYMLRYTDKFFIINRVCFSAFRSRLFVAFDSARMLHCQPDQCCIFAKCV